MLANRRACPTRLRRTWTKADRDREGRERKKEKENKNEIVIEPQIGSQFVSQFTRLN